jgi:hypothetical protein
MFSFRFNHRSTANSVLISLAVAASVGSASAQQTSPTPDFFMNGAGWVGMLEPSQDLNPIPGLTPPVTFDPAHPYIPNIPVVPGRTPTFRVADLSNPNLMPWVKARMKVENDKVLAGKYAFTPRSSCNMSGVPTFAQLGGAIPLYFVQTPKEVWLLFMGDHQIRRVYMNVPHTKNPKPSWYGESVGHYEGDTLVIDTIGQNDKTYVDNYRTPHTDKLHVVERWKLTNGGQNMEVRVTVDDPGAFYKPWSGMRRYRRVQEAMPEDVCAENNQHFDFPIPVANKADF